MFGLVKQKEEKPTLAYMDKGGSVDLFNVMSTAIAKPNTRTANTQMAAPFAPGEIGAAISPDLNMDAKQVVAQVGNHFPTRGMEPEQKAQMNLLATNLMPKAAADAKFYTDKAKSIMNCAADIHTSQVSHKANAFEADLKMKKADVDHLGHIQGWQAKTLSLTEIAREKYAGIALAASCL